MATILPADDAFWRPSNVLGVRNTDLAAQTGAATVGARLWRLVPGQASTLHRHRTQDELYVLLEGTGRIRVDGTEHTLQPHAAVHVPAAELRQLFNDTGADALWLVAGAPVEAANTLEMTPELLATMYPEGPLAGAGPELFVDLGSPYAWLALERFDSVVGVRPIVQPVLLGAIFAATGRSSWARTSTRETGMATVEARAAAAGLPPVVWPQGWPGNYLPAMRALTWAARHGATTAFARAALHAAFTTGADLGDPVVLRSVAGAVGLDPEAMDAGIATTAVKDELRAATERALRLGVTGVPTTRVGETLLWGDDRLEDAAALVQT